VAVFPNWQKTPIRDGGATLGGAGGGAAAAGKVLVISRRAASRFGNDLGSLVSPKGGAGHRKTMELCDASLDESSGKTPKLGDMGDSVCPSLKTERSQNGRCLARVGASVLDGI